jgi:hypothetical protein
MSNQLSTNDPAQSSVLGFSLEQPASGDAELNKQKQQQKHVQYKPMKKMTMLFALGATMVLMTSVSKATIVGSSHDFYYNTDAALWGGSAANNPYNGGTGTSNTANSVCSECHSIHHNQDASKGPLWVHKASATVTYTTYNLAGSETYDALGITAPSLGGTTIACLSCHDGTVGVNEQTKIGLNGLSSTTDSYGKGTNAFALNSGTGRLITIGGNDLTHTHPIGISYTEAATKVQTVSGVNQFQSLTTGVYPKNRLKGLNGDRIECSTCHDIHNVVSIPKGTAKCIACHIK